jgi:LPXTG-motif cell wall-anchored protein
MRGRMLAAVLLGVVGLGWMAQGLGFLPGTGFMDGDVTWAAIGAVLLVAGVALGISAWRRRPPSPVA